MKRTALSLAALLLTGCMMFMKAPSDPKAYERTQVGATQTYRATFAPADSIKVGQLHKWNIVVTTADGAPQKHTADFEAALRRVEPRLAIQATPLPAVVAASLDRERLGQAARRRRGVLAAGPVRSVDRAAVLRARRQ